MGRIGLVWIGISKWEYIFVSRIEVCNPGIISNYVLDIKIVNWLQISQRVSGTFYGFVVQLDQLTLFSLTNINNTMNVQVTLSKI